ncbi:MAG: ADP-glyceromanno-heptose 6-epimerase [Ignavibacteria bacterium]|nr:ADP-glyceromanno-heptose 6-epimerase [Ignavibacteria bacterium]MCU7503252.1 ADP-glyceromanno-heptose 6-epimerase [Ignavibacteria bacterium]MCU7515802.1 ADP-glyceromanno-heptose 6-epimerase [Ignavibacteria bacterium]
MIVVTGGAGFIGSAIVWRLNLLGQENIIIVDSLGTGEKWKNLVGLKYADVYNKKDFIQRVIEENVPFDIDAIIHMGACSSTTEKDADYLLENNYRYTTELVKYCLPRKARFIYASSAATYGDGSQGYNDNENELQRLQPLNMYGYSKHMFDIWARRMKILDKIAGMKFFNVYGPNEYHKADMRSVIHKAYGQILETGKVKLFKSYHPNYKDGEQMRDFVYVKDVVDMTLFFLENRDKNGIYNIGSGKARTWNDLIKAIFSALKLEPQIEYIEMPEVLKNKYQYFTEANLGKVIKAGYTKPVTSLEDGVKDYVINYLRENKYLGSELAR